MKILSFLAGAAAGALAHQWMTRRSVHPEAPARPFSGRAFHPAPIAPADELSAEPTHTPPGTDDQLCERIRAHLVRTIANAQAIDIAVTDGCVTLTGEVQARDAVLLMTQVENVPGVQRVDNKLAMQGSIEGTAPPMTRDPPAARDGERASSHVS